MIQIYCDGAASNNGMSNAVGGYGFIVLNDTTKEVLFCGGNRIEGATNQQMELAAAIFALKSLSDYFQTDKSLRSNYIQVNSDSAYLINCYKQKWYKNWIKNGWKNSRKEPVANKEMWETLMPAFDNEKVDFVKVKGHNGNKYNEIADKIAVAARTMSSEDFVEFQSKIFMEVYK